MVLQYHYYLYDACVIWWNIVCCKFPRNMKCWCDCFFAHVRNDMFYFHLSFMQKFSFFISIIWMLLFCRRRRSVCVNSSVIVLTLQKFKRSLSWFLRGGIINKSKNCKSKYGLMESTDDDTGHVTLTKYLYWKLINVSYYDYH